MTAATREPTAAAPLARLAARTARANRLAQAGAGGPARRVDRARPAAGLPRAADGAGGGRPAVVDRRHRPGPHGVLGRLGVRAGTLRGGAVLDRDRLLRRRRAARLDDAVRRARPGGGPGRLQGRDAGRPARTAAVGPAGRHDAGLGARVGSGGAVDGGGMAARARPDRLPLEPGGHRLGLLAGRAAGRRAGRRLGAQPAHRARRRAAGAGGLERRPARRLDRGGRRGRRGGGADRRRRAAPAGGPGVGQRGARWRAPAAGPAGHSPALEMAGRSAARTRAQARRAVPAARLCGPDPRDLAGDGGALLPVAPARAARSAGARRARRRGAADRGAAPGHAGRPARLP